MIQANELRVGNWAYYTSGEPVWVVKNYVQLSLDNFTKQNLEFIKPIPLTHEILEKAGWIKVLMHDGFYSYVKNGIHISMPYFHFSYNDGDSNIELKSLHQLQNLYFALTGTELKISL